MNNVITKYMCTVETKNYPVVAISPAIQRYSTIRKKLNASEIAICLSYCANVTLHKNNGANVKLTSSTFKKILLDYKNEVLSQELNTKMNAEAKKNVAAAEEMKKEVVEVEEPVVLKTAPEPQSVVEEEPVVVETTEGLEEMQPDPEDTDTSEWSHIYGEEKED